MLLSSLQLVLDTLGDVPDGFTHPCVVESGAMDALAAVLQVTPLPCKTTERAAFCIGKATASGCMYYCASWWSLALLHEVAWTQQHDASARAAQAAPCKNLRELCGGLLEENASSCLAPGLFDAADALLVATQVGLCTVRVARRHDA